MHRDDDVPTSYTPTQIQFPFKSTSTQVQTRPVSDVTKAFIPKKLVIGNYGIVQV